MDYSNKNLPLNAKLNVVSDLLDYMAEHYPQKGYGYIAADGTEIFYTYPEIKDKALKVLDCLQKNGLKAGDIISVETEEVYIFHIMFWACMYGGIIISSIQSPASWDIHSKSMDIFTKQLKKLEMPVVVTQKSHQSNYEELKSLNDNFSMLIFEELLSENYGVRKEMQPDDTVYIQFSSGTTGVPEGAMLSNKNIIFSCRATAVKTELDEDDIIFSWLPHTHNLGLFVPTIISVMLGNSGYFMKPGVFLQNPLLFLKKIEEHRGTWFCTNNFGLEWLTQKIPESSINELDLHSMRAIFAGAENISQSTINKVSNKFASCGINQKMIRPGYGMTEATLVVSVTKMSGPVVECISRKSMMYENKAVLNDSSNTNDAVFFTGNGAALDGIDVRIVDDNHNSLPDRNIGEVEVKGDCLFREYYNEPEVTANKMYNGWLRTGDLGYLSNEQLFIVGRKKDVAVIRGVNYVITDIEECISNNVGIPKAILAIASVMSENQEELVAFVQYQESIEKFVELYKKIYSTVLEYYQIKLKAILPIKLIPKTASGKIMRYMLKMQYENNMFSAIQEEVESAIHISDSFSDKYDNVNSKNEIETKILDCWSEILHISTDKIPVYKTFSSLGGNSIQAYQLLLLLSKTFNTDLGQEVIAKYDTVSKMAHYLENFSGKKEENVYKRNASDDKVVITGVAFRLPEANTQEEFWNNLKNGHDSIKRVSEKRKTLAKSPKWNDWIGEVEDIDSFDYDFFDMTYDEAKFMDPQQRLAMETAYEALEDAGMIQDEFETENVGVYACVCENSYEPIVFDYIDKNGYDDVPPRTLVNNMHNMIAARVSHQYGFTGPVMAVDSACSSFMTAVHMAKSTILDGDVEGAVIIGTNLIATEYVYGLAKNGGIISSTNMSKVFDTDADGSILGEGVVVMYLEKMSTAVKNHKQIYGVIHGSAINNDGYALSVTSPNPRGEYDVIRKAYADSDISSNDVSYIEVHGTGTTIGDPIEINALSRQFGDYPKDRKIAIGSVKTNIGHLLPAAASVGILKVLLCLKHNQLVPSLHMDSINPLLEIDKKPFHIVTENEPWKVYENGKRIAGITSLGLGGTNAHLIVGEYENDKSEHIVDNKKMHILTVSAKTEKALTQIIKQTMGFLENSGVHISDLCMTRNRFRKHYTYRAACIVDEKGNIISNMETGKMHKQIVSKAGICIGKTNIISCDDFNQICQRMLQYKYVIASFGGFYGIGNGTAIAAYLNGIITEAEAWKIYSDGVKTEISDVSYEKVSECDIVMCIGDFKEMNFETKSYVLKLDGSYSDDYDKDFLENMRKLYLNGANIRWDVIYPNDEQNIISLPSYPFEKNHVWLD